MTSTQARIPTVIVSLVACFAAVAIAQTKHWQRVPVPVVPTSAPVASAFDWPNNRDISVPDATAAFAALKEPAVDTEPPTF